MNYVVVDWTKVAAAESNGGVYDYSDEASSFIIRR
jgi:hypothetical protein